MVPSIGPSEWSALAALRDAWSGARIAIGIHPHALASLDDGALDRALARIEGEARGARAIGECGLDARIGVPIARQERALDAQLAIARRLGLPVIAHVVGADAAMHRAVDRCDVRGVIHGFTGAIETARRWIGRGWVIGLGARVLDPRARRVRACARGLPLSAIVIETDDAGPERLSEVAGEVARLRGIEERAVREATFDRAVALFGS